MIPVYILLAFNFYPAIQFIDVPHTIKIKRPQYFYSALGFIQ